VQDAVDTVKYKTSVVASNGFNPVWQERVVFKVYRPDTCFLYIAVHDMVDVTTMRTALLAYFVVPLSAVRVGYRCCPLRNVTGKKLPCCSLLCRFQKLPLE
jgi:hypothetical protein